MRNAILLLIALSVSGCSFIIKEGGPVRVDPLTRKEYKVEPK